MQWTAIDKDGWTADYRVRLASWWLPQRIEGRWAWPGTPHYVLEMKFHVTGQPDADDPARWIGRYYGEWFAIDYAWTAWALYARRCLGQGDELRARP